mgnify:CR=1 FL=1
MTGYLVIGAVLLLALAVVVYDRWRTACTMKRLDDMLTAAMNGSFSEGTFDESRLLLGLKHMEGVAGGI